VVNKGDIIGYTGTPAGTNTNDHLHYEIHLINGDPNLPNPRTSKMLKQYSGDQNAGNNTPWNALLFYTPRIINYSLHQGETIGFLGKYPEYPTADMLKQNNSSHLAPLSPLALAYYRYGISNVWKPQGAGVRFPNGVVTLDQLEEKLKTIPDWKPVEASFLG
jgi:murein DD-endopeptidase MepM/ murein hydrolase activator NlpD